MGNITKGNFGRKAERMVARKKRRKIFLIILGFIILVTGIFLSPLFNIRNIVVKGVNELNEEDIIRTSGINTGMHIVSLDLSQAEENLSKVPHISSVNVKYQFPNTIEIIIEEKMPIVYYEFADGYVGINSDGIITDIVEMQNTENPLPVATGIVLETYSIGSKPELDAVRQAQIDVLIEVSEALYELDMSGTIREIDVSEITNIILYTHSGLTVKCGSTDELEYKFSALKEVIPQADSGGIADLSTPGQVILTIN